MIVALISDENVIRRPRQPVPEMVKSSRVVIIFFDTMLCYDDIVDIVGSVEDVYMSHPGSGDPDPL